MIFITLDVISHAMAANVTHFVRLKYDNSKTFHHEFVVEMAKTNQGKGDLNSEAYFLNEI